VRCDSSIAHVHGAPNQGLTVQGQGSWHWPLLLPTSPPWWAPTEGHASLPGEAFEIGHQKHPDHFVHSQLDPSVWVGLSGHCEFDFAWRARGCCFSRPWALPRLTGITVTYSCPVAHSRLPREPWCNALRTPLERCCWTHPRRAASQCLGQSEGQLLSKSNARPQDYRRTRCYWFPRSLGTPFKSMDPQSSVMNIFKPRSACTPASVFVSMTSRSTKLGDSTAKRLIREQTILSSYHWADDATMMSWRTHRVAWDSKSTIYNRGGCGRRRYSPASKSSHPCCHNTCNRSWHRRKYPAGTFYASAHQMPQYLVGPYGTLISWRVHPKQWWQWPENGLLPGRSIMSSPCVWKKGKAVKRWPNHLGQTKSTIQLKVFNFQGLLTGHAGLAPQCELAHRFLLKALNRFSIKLELVEIIAGFLLVGTSPVGIATGLARTLNTKGHNCFWPNRARVWRTSTPLCRSTGLMLLLLAQPKSKAVPLATLWPVPSFRGRLCCSG